MKRLLLLVIALLTFNPAYSELLSKAECEAIYNAARDTCSRTYVACSKVSQCKRLRETCNADVSTPEGCGALSACAKEASPVLYGSRCRYTWTGGEQGRCANANNPMEQVAYLCPGVRFASKPSNRDPGFNCQGQINDFGDRDTACRAAIMDYFQRCPADVPRVTISPAECPDAKAPAGTQ